ncbi:MAG: hypothetical protein GC139_06450 [Sideroxydans sp.]|nr:hypothetical protein [Sideroxydans sp.]
MSASKEVLLGVLQEAARGGDELIPNELIAAVLNQPEPIKALSDHDQGNLFFEAIRRQFDFIAFLKVTEQCPSVENINRWASLMRWFIRELQGWQLSNDPKFHKLTVLFVVSAYCDWNGDLWAALPDGAEQNNDLLHALERLIAGIRSNVVVRGLGSEPIWEREVVEKLKVADMEKDWLTISELWPSFESSIIPSVFQIQAVRCLYRFGFAILVGALNGASQTILAMQFAGSLSVGQRLALGIASNNHYIQFGSVYQTFFHWPKTNQLGHEEQQSLKQLLLRVADDQLRWEKWMHVFNRYPLRYPAMQQALGEVLAITSETSIIAYIESISLSTTCDGSRRSVAECLRAFRNVAQSDRAKLMWKRAYQRWAQWQFDLDSEDKYLLEIGCSELDYAIVAYVIECLTERERDEAIIRLTDTLRSVDNTWHASLSDCIGYWNRLLSQFQTYAHARQSLSSGEDWLMEGKYYLPYEPQNELYLPMMFHVR